MPNHSYRWQPSMRGPYRARAGVVALCAFFAGCTPELDADASAPEAAVGQADASEDAQVRDASARDATTDPDGASSAAGDASSSPSSDASVPDASTPPPTDASVSNVDASTLDATALDAAALDAAALDAGAADANTAGSDAALDAETRVDATSVDSGSGDAAIADANLAQRMRSGEVRWGVQSGQGSAFCPYQSIALWKDETLTLEDRSSKGFACTEWFETCARPAPGEVTNVTFIFQNADMEVHLTFRGSVLQTGYSIQAFRENLLQVDLRWTSETKTNIGDRVARYNANFQPTLELVSYEAPMLHVRLQGTADWGPSFQQQATIPYVCIHQSPAPVPEICTEVGCGYRVVDPENGVRVSVDLKARIQQPDP